MHKLPIILWLVCTGYVAYSQPQENRLIINADEGTHIISKHIYGHFAEHLGACIYGGFWVGEDSAIPNVRGIRKDVVQALKQINIPNLRWPGGCFADEYHWMDGIGPRTGRPKMVNTHWGGVVEDNSFGTHEFMDLCEQLGTEPYICGNVGSGSVEEMSKWVEYLTSDGESPMANLRRQNGRQEPWKVKFWGVGNENWGCGGNMTAEYYAGEYRRYSTYCKNYGENRLFKIAGGANSFDYNWTEMLMKNIPLDRMNGISLHYYTVPKTWADKGSATQFDENEYFVTLEKCLMTDELVRTHSTIMDRYDPEKRIGLMVDEWGAWYNVEPGTNPGFLYQQNSLRDAFVAAISLNIFNQHCDRIKMANIAQTINVLQALILTKNEKMILTPTYHVYDMYKNHHDATLLPSVLRTSDYEMNGKKIPSLNASVSKDKNKRINITIANIDPVNGKEISAIVRGMDISSIAKATVLTAKNIGSHNTFENPDEVKPVDFKGAKISKGGLTINMPAKSVLFLQLE